MINVGKLKSLFVTTEEEPKATASASQPASYGSASSAPSVARSVPASDNVVRKMVEHLSNVLLENNQAGFDYMEFRNAVRELVSKGDTESKAFASVYTTASTIGIDKSTLLSSAAHYLSVLTKEKEEFEAEVGKRQSHDLTAKQNRLAAIEEELARLAQEKASLEKEVEELSSKIENNTAGFLEAWQIIHDKVSEDERKIKEYLS